MALFSSRLTHVLTRADLAELLTPTYAREGGVSEELANERMREAMKSKELADRMYEAVSAALPSVQGTKTEDALMDALSKAVPKRAGKIKPASASAGLSAVMVVINIELNLAPLDLRGTLESERGRKILNQGFDGLGKFLVNHLVPLKT